jgi:hypothetical protein
MEAGRPIPLGPRSTANGVAASVARSASLFVQSVELLAQSVGGHMHAIDTDNAE